MLMTAVRYLPDWMPGTGWKRTARQWAAELTDVTEKPYAFVKHQIAQGKNDNSFLSRLLEAGDSTPKEKLTNKWSSLSLYAAGADTVSAFPSCLGGLLMRTDCVSYRMLLPGYVHFSRCSEQGPRGDWPSNRKWAFANLGRPPEFAVRRRSRQRGSTMASGGTHGFASYEYSRWCMRRLLYPQRFNVVCQHLVSLPILTLQVMPN